MTVYDYIVIGFYLVFMFMLGPIYKSFSKTSSDFFRGGGGMLWWVVGSSAFMTTFTAWAFTAGAAKAYETGTFFLVLFACNILALIFCYLLRGGQVPADADHHRDGGSSQAFWQDERADADLAADSDQDSLRRGHAVYDRRIHGQCLQCSHGRY